MTKGEIREQVRMRKRAMSQEEIVQQSKEILALLYETNEYRQADAIYTYVSYNQEVKTHDLICKAIMDGKKVAVPKVCGKEMEFYYIHSLRELQSGYQHILEPVTNEKADLQSEQRPLLLLPGLAFDKQGNRIGYGGGFYDKYLCKQNKTFYTCAMGFLFQLYEHLETEEFDVSADMVITPAGIYHTTCLHRNAERVEEHGVFN